MADVVSRAFTVLNTIQQFGVELVFVECPFCRRRTRIPKNELHGRRCECGAQFDKSSKQASRKTSTL